MPAKLEKVFNACMKSKWAAKQSGGDPKKKESICRATAVKATGQTFQRHDKKSLMSEANEDLMVDMALRITEAKLAKTGNLIVKGIGITEDFAPLEDIIIFHKEAIGAKVLFDHFHPVNGIEVEGIEKRFPVFGYVTDSELVNLGGLVGIELTLSLMGFSPAHKKLQEMIQERLSNNDPLGISAYYIRYFGLDKDTLHLHWEEFSITPHPVCPSCLTSEAARLSKLPTKGENIMEDKPETPVGTESTATTTDPVSLSETGGGANGETEETPISVETLQATIVEMNSVVEAQKTKIGELEALMEARDISISQLSTKLSESNDKINFLEVKKPLLDAIAEKLGGSYKENTKLQEHYAKLPVEILEAEKVRLSKLEDTKVGTVPVDNTPKVTDQPSDDKKLEELFPDLNKIIEDAKRDSFRFPNKV
jgi:hypothetical protein